MIFKSRLTVLCIAIFFCAACTYHQDPAKQLRNLENTDLAFSSLSKQSGMKKAFREYIDPYAVLLRPNHNPIIGDNAIKYIQSQEDSAFTLTWKPEGGEIAESGDLGYTFGLYTLQTKDTIMHGTYVTIWKKQNDGRWKFTLDAGNPGTDQ
jgi:ketosteroid isomerase-like protein